ncbi:hypothetical protein LEP1GSC096_1877 [Leptospira interrogans serovar Hebdomadis str. R499]|uniref:Uncharacterized protein n=2 Tax=Leptospira TaxID=171 RepID=D4YVX9_LEPIN|nr:hypothetical protein LA_2786a [Leptospira interrogans serovar Lai str. 56601]AER03061.1 hypothetical protein LIF_A2275 [Leptospira interrogans serovar Lai str. IPAV]EKO15815.1 hypothetical protein LEP1GSC081_3408 [Leptospira kirschneri str. H1]EKO61464.1 hypothetical protein LEP1GSC082_3377 [Leptospira kirschneri str. H2]EKO69540.1 hypothetical protein LEP1GSC069_2343 [Leptospira interrogans serovar Canicola str. Fiocruz LV133]EKO97958.1 hypothetical protein LEP1GSC057_3609 [Leptospira inte
MISAAKNSLAEEYVFPLLNPVNGAFPIPRIGIVREYK